MGGETLCPGHLVALAGQGSGLGWRMAAVSFRREPLSNDGSKTRGAKLLKVKACPASRLESVLSMRPRPLRAGLVPPRKVDYLVFSEAHQKTNLRQIGSTIPPVPLPRQVDYTIYLAGLLLDTFPDPHFVHVLINMVNTGRPSIGCSSCRESKVKVRA